MWSKHSFDSLNHVHDIQTKFVNLPWKPYVPIIAPFGIIVRSVQTRGYVNVCTFRGLLVFCVVTLTYVNFQPSVDFALQHSWDRFPSRDFSLPGLFPLSNGFHLFPPSHVVNRFVYLYTTTIFISTGNLCLHAFVPVESEYNVSVISVSKHRPAASTNHRVTSGKAA